MPAESSLKNLIRCVTDNLPEYAVSMDCVDWHYKTRTFTFVDPEEGEEYTISWPELLSGAAKMHADWKAGKIHFYGVRSFWNCDEWDAIAVDALVQYAIFGELIYG